MRILRTLGLAAALLLTAGCGGGGGGVSSTANPGSTFAETGGVATLAKSTTAGVGQASLNLQGGSANLGQTAAYNWALAKTGPATVPAGTGSIPWVVTATRTGPGAATLHVGGYVRIYNSGSANAPLGNIVVNLQRKAGGNKWASAACDVADATKSDGATTANIVSGASSEGKSVFTEGPGSGSLQFTDANNNTAFSLVPGFELAPGAYVDLLYLANFDNGALQIPAGESVRAEVIVTFSNAGARGGSGASAENVDVTGDGVAEAYVRSVPDRQTRTVPALQEVQATALLTDALSRVSSAGTVTLSDFTTAVGAGSGSQDVAGSGEFAVGTAYDSGKQGGTATNEATLTAPGSSFTVFGPVDPLTLLPTFQYDFTTRPDLSLRAGHTVVVEAPVPDPGDPPVTFDGFKPGDFATYTQGYWMSKPGGVLVTGFATVFPQGFEVGIPGPSGYSMLFTTWEAVKAWKTGGGTGSALDKDLVNPTSSSGKNFASLVMAASLNLAFSDAGILPSGFGDLVFANYPVSGLNGLTVREVVAEANHVLGGGAPRHGATLGELQDVCDQLTQSFHEGTVVSGFANSYLARP